jgi:hypothetical protein
MAVLYARLVAVAEVAGREAVVTVRTPLPLLVCRELLIRRPSIDLNPSAWEKGNAVFGKLRRWIVQAKLFLAVMLGQVIVPR